MGVATNILGSVLDLYRKGYWSMGLYAYHARLRLCWQTDFGKRRIFCAQQFERKCRTKIAAPGTRKATRGHLAYAAFAMESILPRKFVASGRV